MGREALLCQIRVIKGNPVWVLGGTKECCKDKHNTLILKGGFQGRTSPLVGDWLS